MSEHDDEVLEGSIADEIDLGGDEPEDSFANQISDPTERLRDLSAGASRSDIGLDFDADGTPDQEMDPAQQDFERRLEEAAAMPDSVRRQTSGTGWVSAEGKTIGPEGEEIEWSPQGRLVVAALEEALNTPQCTEIHAYGPDRFSAKVSGQNALLHGLRFDNNEEYLRFVQMLIEESGGELAWRELRTSGQGVLQMRDGSRLMVILPPAVEWAQISIRKHTAKSWDPQLFVANQTMSQPMLDFLQAAVSARANILIVGEAGSGKTTLLRALTNSMGDNERIAVVETVPELMLTKPLTMAVGYREEIEGQGLVDRLEVLLYGSIDRLIVGEVHFRGITKMLEVMTLCEGSLSTYHARSAEQAGERMRVALQMENPSLQQDAAASLLKETLHLVVVLEAIGGQHRVSQIMEVDWRSSGGSTQLTGNNLFVYDRKKQRHKGVNPPDERGPLMRNAREKYGIQILREWFQDPEELAALSRGELRKPT